MLHNPVGKSSAYVLSLAEINLAYHNAKPNLIDSNPVELIFTPNIVVGSISELFQGRPSSRLYKIDNIYSEKVQTKGLMFVFIE